MISLETGEIVKVYGRAENHLRLSALNLFQETSEKKGSKKLLDPLLLGASVGKNRFYIFSDRPPLESEENKQEYQRDV